jgi:hypothetical protein
MIIDFESWETGYADARIGRPSQCPDHLDLFSYLSGYREGRAYHAGIQPARGERLTSLNPGG